LLGTSAWVEPGLLARLAGTEDVITGAALAADPALEAALYRTLKRTPGITSVAVRRALLGNFDALVARSFEVTLGTLVLFACAIAVGVVYNTARITLAERGRELASLRVLGFTRGEVARMLLGQQAVLTVASLPLGAAIGAALAWGVVRAMGSTELWRMPYTISAATFGGAALLVVVASVASGVLVRRRLDRMDLVQVLKTRE
jgi:putative ABC transport system permease protein